MIKNVKIIYTLITLVFTMSFFVQRTLASEISFNNTINLINEERVSRGIPRLRVSEDLNNAAELKSRHMLNRNYFEHYAFGLTPWDFMRISGYDYLYAGENLAMDFTSTEGMVQAWMRSPKHRENILNPSYTEIGLGIVKGAYINEKNGYHETTMVTNMFGRKKPLVLKIYDTFSKGFAGIFQ